MRLEDKIWEAEESKIRSRVQYFYSTVIIIKSVWYTDAREIFMVTGKVAERGTKIQRKPALKLVVDSKIQLRSSYKTLDLGQEHVN